MNLPAIAPATMKAVVYGEYGSADVLRRVELPVPVPGPTDVLVRVRAAGLNPMDRHLMRGDPFLVRLSLGLRRPKKTTTIGSDISGVVEAVGADVSRFSVGDEVFAEVETGGFAEFRVVPERLVAFKPRTAIFEQAAGIGMAGLTALQGLRDCGRIEAGQRVLVNGASGGIGSFGVQIAKSFGAHVTAVCSTRNLDLVRSLGVDEVIDYSAEDFTERRGQFDLVLDTVGNRSIREFRRVLTRNGTFVPAGGGSGWFLGPAAQIFATGLTNPFVSQRLVPVAAKPKSDDLAFLAELIDAGKVTPVIDRVFPFEQAVDAVRYLEARHARGKTIVTVAS